LLIVVQAFPLITAYMTGSITDAAAIVPEAENLV